MDSKAILRRGVVTENPALVQLLGLCPLLAVSTSVVTGLGLAVATVVTLVLSAGLVSMLRAWIRGTVRLPAFVIIVAAVVTVIDLSLPIYLFELHRKLGLFIPLIVTNCVVLARMETFASQRPLTDALFDGLATGCGFGIALVALGLVREFLGTGCILANANVIFPVTAEAWTFCAFDGGLLLVLLPPGAFFTLGLLVVAWRLLTHDLHT